MQRNYSKQHTTPNKQYKTHTDTTHHNARNTQIKLPETHVKTQQLTINETHIAHTGRSQYKPQKYTLYIYTHT